LPLFYAGASESLDANHTDDLLSRSWGPSNETSGPGGLTDEAEHAYPTEFAAATLVVVLSITSSIPLISELWSSPVRSLSSLVAFLAGLVR
jgi:hypothetical protein